MPIHDHIRSTNLALLAALACGTLALACDDASDPVAQDEVPELADDALTALVDTEASADGEIRVHGDVLADLELPRGPRLLFIDLAAADEPPAVGVYEFVPTGHVGTAAFAQLADASPLALFLAATASDVAVPPRLSAAPADRALDPGPQARGWLVTAVADALLPRGTCTNSEFMDAVESYGYNDSGTPVYRLDKEPGTSGFFATNIYNFYPEMAVREAYLYTVGGNAGSTWSNIDAYYTRVAVCALGSHPAACGSGGCVAHPGPTVNIAYRDDNDQPFSFQTVVNHDFSGTGYVHWHWQTGSNYDWRTRIDLAAADDSFDIGHAVQVD